MGGTADANAAEAAKITNINANNNFFVTFMFSHYPHQKYFSYVITYEARDVILASFFDWSWGSPFFCLAADVQRG